MSKGCRRHIVKVWAVNISRLLLGAALTFSGFVKAVDPLGTQYKLQDYLAAMSLSDYVPDMVTLLASVALSSFEFSIGVFLLFAIHSRVASRLAAMLMAVMTMLTVWIYIADPVQDCGCFGDAWVLTNGETLAKNVLLLACALILARWPQSMVLTPPKGLQWVLFHITTLCSLLLSAWCLYDLPVIDFRPYHVGADIRKGMEIPEDAEQPQFDTVFILEKDGKRQEFTLDDYPDSTWTFVDSKTTIIKQGFVPPIHDFSIVDSYDEDITEQVLTRKGYTFLLIAPYLEQADDSNFGDIDQIYEFAHDNSIPFYCLTASAETEIERWKDITGAEYPFCMTDGTTLKTIIRSNPGLLLLREGVVVAKWSHNRLPLVDDLAEMTKH